VTAGVIHRKALAACLINVKSCDSRQVTSHQRSVMPDDFYQVFINTLRWGISFVVCGAPDWVQTHVLRTV